MSEFYTLMQDHISLAPRPLGRRKVYGWIMQASFPGHVGGARKWLENEATALKIGGLVASFPGHVGGAKKWPENEATAVKVGGLRPCGRS